MRSLLALAAVLWCTTTTADTLPRHDPVPGGLAVVAVAPLETARPEAHFGRKRVMVLSAQNHWYAVIGLPASILPGEYLIRVSTAETDEATVRFRVRPPRPGARAGASAERAFALSNPVGDEILDPELHVWRDTQAMDLAFQLPVSTMSAGGPSSTDRADAVDVSVAAPSGGIVAGLLSIHDRRSAVILDHGQGLFSILSPLQRINVAPGATLSKGDPIGTGDFRNAPGRALQWQVIINRTRINPHYLLAEPPAASLLTEG